MNKINHKTIRINLVILIAFLVFSIFNVLMLWHFHKIPMKSLDMTFHWQRIGELLKNDSILPSFATNLFSGNGSAVMTMYPYLFLYPFAILYHFNRSIVTCSLVMLAINTFLSLLVSYFSCLSINKNRLISFVFSVIYSIVPAITAFGLIWFYMGELYAFIFMPVTIFGFLHYIKTGKWVMLSIGITLLIYSSVIMAMITVILLFVWLLINYPNITKNKLINLLKAIGLTLLTGAAFLIPTIKIFLLNDLNDPNTQKVNVANLYSLIMMPLNNQYSTTSLTIYSVLGIVLGLISFKYLSYLIKQSFFIALVIIFISSNYFPWGILDQTPATIIQYTGRMLLIPQVILAYVFSILINRYIRYSSMIKCNNVYLKLGVMLLLIFSYQISNQYGMFHQFDGNRLAASNRIINIPSYQTDVHHNSAYDYYPLKSLKYKNDLLSDKGFYYGKNSSHIKRIHFKLLGNSRFSFHNRFNIKKLNLPFLKYNGVNYRCYLDGDSVKISNQNNVLQIRNVPKNKHYLYIKIMPDKTLILARILTMISIPLYLYLYALYIKGQNHRI